MDGEEGFEEIYRRACGWYRCLNQRDYWLPDGKPPVQIAGMDAAWRHNAAAYLVRNAPGYAMQYSFGQVLSVRPPREDTMAADVYGRGLQLEQAERFADPAAWIKTLPVYKALVEGLPENVAELATHWSTCPVRAGQPGECTCSHHAAIGGAQ